MAACNIVTTIQSEKFALIYKTASKQLTVTDINQVMMAAMQFVYTQLWLLRPTQKEQIKGTGAYWTWTRHKL